MRRSVAVGISLLLLACAHKTAPEPEPATSNPTIAEGDGTGLSADACSHYLSDAPPPSSGEFMPVSEEELAAAMAKASQETTPRCAHYHFAHNLVVTMLFDDPRFSQALWEHEEPVGLLDIVADGVNKICAEGDPGAWQMPNPGFRLGRTEVLDRPVIVVDVIPPPEAMIEAHLFAVVGRPWPAGVDHRRWTGLDRYFVLEHSVGYEPTHTVMGGWTRTDSQNTHLNFGRGPTPTATAFLHVIGQNLCADFTEARTTISR